MEDNIFDLEKCVINSNKFYKNLITFATIYECEDQVIDILHKYGVKYVYKFIKDSYANYLTEFENIKTYSQFKYLKHHSDKLKKYLHTEIISEGMINYKKNKYRKKLFVKCKKEIVDLLKYILKNYDSSVDLIEIIGVSYNKEIYQKYTDDMFTDMIKILSRDVYKFKQLIFNDYEYYMRNTIRIYKYYDMFVNWYITHKNYLSIHDGYGAVMNLLHEVKWK